MFQSNYNIVGFLKKKSFFDESAKKTHLLPVHNHQFKEKSKTQGKKQYYRTPSAVPNQKHQYYDSFTNQSNRRNFHFNDNYRYGDRKSNQDFFHHKRSLDRMEHKFFDSRMHSLQAKTQYNSREKYRSPLRKEEEKITIKKYAKIKSQSKNQLMPKFQSSKIQSKMCLDDLHKKLQTQLGSIDKIINEYAMNLEAQFYSQLSSIKNQINRLVEEVFSEAKTSLEQQLNRQKETIVREAMTIKYQLKIKEQKIKEMRSQMNHNWRKIAGELLSTQIQKEVQSLINESQYINSSLKVRTPNIYSIKNFSELKTHLLGVITNNI